MVKAPIVMPATADHVQLLWPNMSLKDTQEVWAAAHHTPKQALEEAFGISKHIYSAFFNRKILCMGGVADAPCDAGVPWLLGTEELPKYGKSLLKESRKWINVVEKEYRILYNFVDTRNAPSKRWLNWLGFTIHPAKPYGPDDMLFHLFTLENPYFGEGVLACAA